MSYKITFTTSEKTVDAQSDEVILDAALNAGMMLPHSCRGGTCGSCAARLVEGEVSYPEGQPRSLSEAAQAEGQILLCQARAQSDLVVKERPLASDVTIPIQMMPVRVLAVNKLNHDVAQLLLQPPGSRRLQFMAGQYIDILLNDGRRRSFSLANPPHDNEALELHIRRVPGGHFTNLVFDELQEKALLRIQGPIGSFFIRHESTRPILMIAGGTGYAPMAGMIKDLIHQGSTRPVHLFWGARSVEDLYLDEPAAWAEEHAWFSYTPVLSDCQDAAWNGARGFVHTAVMAAYPELSGHEVYMAGPPPMIAAAKEGFSSLGLPDEHLYYDAFDFSHS